MPGLTASSVAQWKVCTVTEPSILHSVTTFLPAQQPWRQCVLTASQLHAQIFGEYSTSKNEASQISFPCRPLTRTLFAQYACSCCSKRDVCMGKAINNLHVSFIWVSDISSPQCKCVSVLDGILLCHLLYSLPHDEIVPRWAVLHTTGIVTHHCTAVSITKRNSFSRYLLSLQGTVFCWSLAFTVSV